MLPGDGRIIWFCKLVRLSKGVLVSVVQFALLKFEIFCKTKFVEGIVQEKARLLFAVARHNDGLGTV